MCLHLLVCCSQVGPCTGIDAGDQMWMSRYLMYRVCEMFNVSDSLYRGSPTCAPTLSLRGWSLPVSTT